MIKINKIPAPTVDLYSPIGHLLGTVNEYEFNDVRIQIMESQLEGYYIVDASGACFYIDKNGRLPLWPKCFDLMSDQLTKLVKWA